MGGQRYLAPLLAKWNVVFLCRMKVVDPHIHLWNPETGRHPTLKAPGKTFMGDYKAFAETHEVTEFLKELMA